MKKGREITAEELMKQLQNDPVYVAKMKAKEELRLASTALARADEQVVLNELRQVGVSFGSFMELLYSNRDYSAAIPLLLDHLGKPHEPGVVGSIACALIVPQCKRSPQVLSALIDAFRRESRRTPRDRSATDGIADAISRLAGQEYEEVFRDILRDEMMGPSRGFLVLSRVIIKSQRPDTCEFLTGLLDDGDIQFLLCVIGAIVKRRCPTALELLDRLSSHPDSEVAKQAKAAVKKWSKKK
jgi:hypothetical protein